MSSNNEGSFDAVDEVISIALQRIGCAIPDRVFSVGLLGAGGLADAVARALYFITDGDTELSGLLPTNVAARQQTCDALAGALRDAGCPGPLARYERLMYPKEASSRLLLLWLLENLPEGGPEAMPATAAAAPESAAPEEADGNDGICSGSDNDIIDRGTDVRGDGCGDESGGSRDGGGARDDGGAIGMGSGGVSGSDSIQREPADSGGGGPCSDSGKGGGHSNGGVSVDDFGRSATGMENGLGGNSGTNAEDRYGALAFYSDDGGASGGAHDERDDDIGAHVDAGGADERAGRTDGGTEGSDQSNEEESGGAGGGREAKDTEIDAEGAVRGGRGGGGGGGDLGPAMEKASAPQPIFNAGTTAEEDAVSGKAKTGTDVTAGAAASAGEVMDMVAASAVEAIAADTGDAAAVTASTATGGAAAADEALQMAADAGADAAVANAAECEADSAAAAATAATATAESVANGGGYDDVDYRRRLAALLEAEEAAVTAEDAEMESLLLQLQALMEGPESNPQLASAAAQNGCDNGGRDGRDRGDEDCSDGGRSKKSTNGAAAAAVPVGALPAARGGPATTAAAASKSLEAISLRQELAVRAAELPVLERERDEEATRCFQLREEIAALDERSAALEEIHRRRDAGLHALRAGPPRALALQTGMMEAKGRRRELAEEWPCHRE
ncbi:unnamed protein product, partial [Phaeothamnion confervicola]